MSIRSLFARARWFASGVIRSLFARARWFASGVMGADKYQKYLAHHRASGCTHEPMTEREFWKDYTDSLDKNPGARCC